jgi:hypothetical protein
MLFRERRGKLGRKTILRTRGQRNCNLGLPHQLRAPLKITPMAHVMLMPTRGQQPLDNGREVTGRGCGKRRSRQGSKKAFCTFETIIKQGPLHRIHRRPSCGITGKTADRRIYSLSVDGFRFKDAWMPRRKHVHDKAPRRTFALFLRPNLPNRPSRGSRHLLQWSFELRLVFRAVQEDRKSSKASSHPIFPIFPILLMLGMGGIGGIGGIRGMRGIGVMRIAFLRM